MNNKDCLLLSQSNKLSAYIYNRKVTSVDFLKSEYSMSCLNITPKDIDKLNTFINDVEDTTQFLSKEEHENVLEF